MSIKNINKNLSAMTKKQKDIIDLNELAMLYLGENIKNIRKANKQTLEEVSKKVSVSKSLLSQIEKGKVNPSINTLWGIANALGVSVGDLFEVTKIGTKKFKIEPVSKKIIPEGTTYYILSLSLVANKTLSEFVYATFELGSSTGKKLGSHGGVETVIVIEGKLEVNLAGKKYFLKKDESFTFPGNIPHGLKNIGTKRTIILFLTTHEKEK